MRLFENERKRGRVILSSEFPLQEAYRCNLLEEDQEKLMIEDGKFIPIELNPYQIVSIRLVPK